MREDAASRTAVVVAKSQALIGMSPDSADLVDPEAFEFAKAALMVAGHGRFVRRLRSAAFRRLVCVYESLMIPGLAKHHVLRKRIIERKVREALQSGVGQVIQIGAGLDSLCFRLHHEWHGVKFVEFDHPATQSLKREVLDTMPTGDNLILRPLELEDSDLGKMQVEAGDGPLLVIAEGVLMYLSSSRIAPWLRTWRAFAPSGSQLLFTFMDGPGFWKQSPLVNWWLRRASEPFRWHARPEDMRLMLRDFGWNLGELYKTWDEARDDRVARGEWVGEAMAAQENGALGEGATTSARIANDSVDVG